MLDIPTPRNGNGSGSHKPQIGGHPIKLDRKTVEQDPVWTTYDNFGQHVDKRKKEMMAVVDVDLKEPLYFDDYFKDLKEQILWMRKFPDTYVKNPAHFRPVVRSYQTVSELIEFSAALDAFTVLHIDKDPRVASYFDQTKEEYDYTDGATTLRLINGTLAEEFGMEFKMEGEVHPLTKELKELKPIEPEGPPTRISYVS